MVLEERKHAHTHVPHNTAQKKKDMALLISTKGKVLRFCFSIAKSIQFCRGMALEWCPGNLTCVQIGQVATAYLQVICLDRRPVTLPEQERMAGSCGAA